MLKTSLSIISLIFFIACSPISSGIDNSSGEIELEVKGYKVPCIAVAQTSCMVIKLKDGDYLGFHGTIDGFEYEWGYDYTLSIRTTTIVDAPQDSLNIQYELIDMIKSEINTDSVFEIFIYPFDEYEITGDTLKIAGYEKEIFNVSEEDKMSITNNTDTIVTLEINFTDKSKLLLKGVTIVDPNTSCSYNDSTYQYGTLFSSMDGCNTCTCNADGITCTELACSSSGESSSLLSNISSF